MHICCFFLSFMSHLSINLVGIVLYFIISWSWSSSQNLMNHFAGVDIDAATQHKIKVARIPGHVTGNSASCAEMAIYLMLGLLRKQVNFFELIICKKLCSVPFFL